MKKGICFALCITIYVIFINENSNFKMFLNSIKTNHDKTINKTSIKPPEILNEGNHNILTENMTNLLLEVRKNNIKSEGQESLVTLVRHHYNNTLSRVRDYCNKMRARKFSGTNCNLKILIGVARKIYVIVLRSR